MRSCSGAILCLAQTRHANVAELAKQIGVLESLAIGDPFLVGKKPWRANPRSLARISVAQQQPGPCGQCCKDTALRSPTSCLFAQHGGCGAAAIVCVLHIHPVQTLWLVRAGLPLGFLTGA